MNLWCAPVQQHQPHAQSSSSTSWVVHTKHTSESVSHNEERYKNDIRSSPKCAFDWHVIYCSIEWKIIIIFHFDKLITCIPAWSICGLWVIRVFGFFLHKFNISSWFLDITVHVEPTHFNHVITFRCALTPKFSPQCDHSHRHEWNYHHAPDSGTSA